MQSIKKLSPSDQDNLREETSVDLQALETVRTRPKYVHLPVISVK